MRPRSVSPPLWPLPYGKCLDRAYSPDSRSAKKVLPVDRGQVSQARSRVRCSSISGTDTAFEDNLVMPRMVLPLDDRLVIAETYTGEFVSYRDGNGDGVADLLSGGPTKGEPRGSGHRAKQSEGFQ
jgi:hypothetical protein